MLRTHSEGRNNHEGFEEGTAGSDISSSVGLLSCPFSLDSALLAFSLYYVRREGRPPGRVFSETGRFSSLPALG